MLSRMLIAIAAVAILMMGCTAHINPATNMTFGEEVVLTETCCRLWKADQECFAAPDISEDAYRYLYFHYCDFRDGGGGEDNGSDADSGDTGDDGGESEGECEGRGEYN